MSELENALDGMNRLAMTDENWGNHNKMKTRRGGGQNQKQKKNKNRALEP